MNPGELEKLAVASRKATILSSLGALIILSSLAYSAYKIVKVESVVKQKQIELLTVDDKLKKQEVLVNTLNQDIKNLQNTQNGLLDFIAQVTYESQLSIFDRDVDWRSVKADIDKLPSGNRKQSILTAILLAWKEIPFKMGKHSVNGFDSPRFIEYVLSKNGIKVVKEPNERMSDALMRSFKKVEKPEPGDLVFYKGQVGSFGLIYISNGQPSSAGVGIGTLQASDPLQIINLDNINTPIFPLIGYFHVVYPDETLLGPMQ